jgi:hypothetical protein
VYSVAIVVGWGISLYMVFLERQCVWRHGFEVHEVTCSFGWSCVGDLGNKDAGAAQATGTYQFSGVDWPPDCNNVLLFPILEFTMIGVTLTSSAHGYFQ